MHETVDHIWGPIWFHPACQAIHSRLRDHHKLYVGPYNLSWIACWKVQLTSYGLLRYLWSDFVAQHQSEILQSNLRECSLQWYDEI